MTNYDHSKCFFQKKSTDDRRPVIKSLGKKSRKRSAQCSWKSGPALVSAPEVRHISPLCVLLGRISFIFFFLPLFLFPSAPSCSFLIDCFFANESQFLLFFHFIYYRSLNLLFTKFTIHSTHCHGEILS